jgi:hypothetical protein
LVFCIAAESSCVEGGRCEMGWVLWEFLRYFLRAMCSVSLVVL